MTAEQIDRSTDRRTEQMLKLSALLLLLIGCLVVLWPFLSAVMWAIVLCFTTWPVYARLLVALRGRRTFAAAIMTVAILLIFIAPFAVMGASLADDVHRAFDQLQQALHGEPPAFFARIPMIGGWLTQAWNNLAGPNAGRIAQLRQLLEPIQSTLVAAGLGIGTGILKLVLSLLISFFLYRDGIAVAEQATLVIDRLGGVQGRSLLDLAGRTVRGVVYGILGTALVQSVIAGIGFAIAAVPQAALLAFLTFFLSVLPVGPPLVWIPVTIWLYAKGSTGWAIFMLAWGVLVSSVDNVVKPLIISRGGSLPFIIILLGILGGAIAFGFIGVFLGPTLLAVGYQILLSWTKSRTAPISATT